MTIPTLNKNIFRENAINNLNSLNEINPILKIVNSNDWICIFVVLLALIGILIWIFLGTITLNVNGQGIIYPDNKLEEADKLITQTKNDQYEKIELLNDLYNRKKQMFESHNLTIDDLLKAKEAYIDAKEELTNPNKTAYTPLINLMSDASFNSSNAMLDALIFVDHAQGKKISIGMEAYILPKILSPYDYGYIHGKVIGVSAYPISKQLAYSYLGNMNLVDDFFLDGAPFIVKIRLKRNASMISGLDWTTRQGADFTIQPGTMVMANIVYRKCSPIRYLSKK